MKLKGKRIKCIKSFSDFTKGEKFKIIKVNSESLICIDNKKNKATVSLDNIKTHFKILKKKIVVEEPIKKKRILFPWMKTEEGRNYKTMLAVLADQEGGWAKVVSGELTYNAYLNKIVEKTNKIFPNMYKTVADFYKERGRILSEKEFHPIAIGRITMMFSFDKNNKKIVKEVEHPDLANGKLDEAKKYCLKLLKK